MLTVSKLRAIPRNFLVRCAFVSYAADWAPELPIQHRRNEHVVSTVIPLLTLTQRTRLPERAREVIEYRKSGLSLNHIQGCPLDCAYCIRHSRIGYCEIRFDLIMIGNNKFFVSH